MHNVIWLLVLNNCIIVLNDCLSMYFKTADTRNYQLVNEMNKTDVLLNTEKPIIVLAL